MNYFLANKELDFLRGYAEGAVFRNNRIELQKDTAKAVFFSRVFDSREEGTVWHRFVADIENMDAASIKFQIYATDSDSISIEGQTRLLSDYIKDADIEIKDKKKTLEPLLRKVFYDSNDVILFDVKGRYLFYLCELSARDAVVSGVGDVTLYFPRQSWTQLLPGVYSNIYSNQYSNQYSNADPSGVTPSDFTDRFLAIFQSVYDDMDRKIKESPRLMDPMCAERSMLEELAGWFGYRNLYLWPDDKLRELVLRANDLTNESGTVKGIGDILEIYLGERPEIIECFKVAKSGSMEEQIEYGTDPYKYVINVKDKYLRSRKDYNALMCIVADNSPAHMSVRLRPVIEPADVSGNAYLGINTGIGTPDKEAQE